LSGSEEQQAILAEVADLIKREMRSYPKFSELGGLNDDVCGEQPDGTFVHPPQQHLLEGDKIPFFTAQNVIIYLKGEVSFLFSASLGCGFKLKWILKSCILLIIRSESYVSTH
jgi:hypothetical protein